ncbi:DNA-directed RNA polymerase III subunit RPC6 isoform X1 [Ananas comosus]|uniref:DNA-directed RNA polymerase III subunit RPC6 isoform X1 n=3 Tax=Ananas comosus TaxID=4615 RepID=A0A6P5EM62_ANACO|nr:DNA-directed RNA polymerase III subunit RPC6 isoform X1 [Ananas comosus]
MVLCIAEGAKAMVPQKRPRLGSKSGAALVPDEGLSDAERMILEAIRSKENMGIWTFDLKKLTNLPRGVFDKALRLLQQKGLIKCVVSIHNKSRKMYVAREFEPAKEISGGTWYSQGSLNQEFISDVRSKCLAQVTRLRIATIEDVWKGIQMSRDSKADFTLQQIKEIVQAMVLDKELEEVKSTGDGDFSAVPAGRPCYRRFERRAPIAGALSAIPCGVCPRISECTPDGVISPNTCIYFTKWLELDF